MTYSKKQMQPLINKYQINPDTNQLFRNIVEMYDGQPNYQLWAVKVIFSKACTFEELIRIHDWAEDNQTMVKLLSKHNIVSYASKSSIASLFREINGLNNLAIIKEVVSCFNTAQRKMLIDSITPNELTPLEANSNPTIKKWSGIFTKFSKLSSAKRQKFFSMSSSFTDVEKLKESIINAIEERYDWDREDFLRYLEANANDCTVVYDNGSQVIVQVPSFTSSRKLCGGGRTSWCITKEDHFFRDYVTSYDGRAQYFLFDFKRNETDCFAHVGFTIENGKGFLYAQTCDNKEMLNVKHKQGKEEHDIKSLLKSIGVGSETFMRLNGTPRFTWDFDEFLEFVSKNEGDMKAVLAKGHECVIVEVNNDRGLTNIIGHTYIRRDNFSFDPANKVYVLLNFAKKYDMEMSMVAMSYRKDQYGCYSVTRCIETYGSNVTDEKWLNSLGIKTADFIAQKGIDKRILFHKYIDEKDELSALELLASEGNGFDVNYCFNNRVPIFSAINNKMFKLFDAIVEHPKYDSTTQDGFGETLLESLLYLYGCEEITHTKSDDESLKRMINSILASDSYDVNDKDLNGDVALNIACEYQSMLWVVKDLVSKKRTDVNVVNFFQCSAVSQCIRNKNFEALKLLGMRPDLVISSDDEKLAKSLGVNLKEYIKPTESIFNAESESMAEEMAVATA